MLPKPPLAAAPSELIAHARRSAEALFGPGVLEFEGVSQISATVRAADGCLHVLDIGARPPPSELDFFGLNLARARAEAILTSAENIRREASLSHRLSGAHADALLALREGLEKSAPPLCVILSESGNLPLEHPVWSDGTPKVVLTSPEMEEPLAKRLQERARVCGLTALTPRIAVAFLLERVRTIDIEAGPRISNQLTAAPALIQELLLSRFDGRLPSGVLGARLRPDDELFLGLTCVHEVRAREPSGPWTFQRWVKAR